MSEIDIEFDEGGDESYPDTLPGPDSLLHCGGDAQTMLAYWCGQLGQEVEGSAMSLCEMGALSVLELATGEWLSPKDIMAKARKPLTDAAKVRAIKP